MPAPKDPIKNIEWKRKISETNKRLGITPPKEFFGRKRGFHHSVETIRKSILARKGNHYPKMSLSKSGNKNPNWKGGITSINKTIRHNIQYRLWREAVFARDNWTCQKCRQRGSKLHPHHIKNFAQFPELRFALDNGITFCIDCHKLFHKVFGNKNNNQEQLSNFGIKLC